MTTIEASARHGGATAFPSRSAGPEAAWTNPLTVRVTVAVLTLAGLGIRLVIVRGFWLDEATSGYDARLSYHAMLKALTHDNHPPLEYSILWAVAHTIGSTQTDLRLPSILFGTLTIPMLYLAGKSLYHEKVGVLAATFGTVGALSVWYSQEARMYALFILLATVTIWAQSRILARPGARYWVVWVAAATAMIWTQWFAALAVGAEILYFVGVLVRGRHEPSRRRQVGHLVLAVTGVAVLCAPGIPLLLTQFHNNQASGLGFGAQTTSTSASGTSPYGIFNNLVWALWGYHSNGVIAGIVAVWPLGIVGVLLLLGRGRHGANRQLLVVIVVPAALIFAASTKANPSRSLFEIRYFIEAVPALYLLLAGLAWNMTPSIRARRVFVTVLLASLVTGLVLQQSDSHNPRLYGYEAAFAQISSVALPGAEILYAPAYLNVDVEYFEPGLRSTAVTGAVPRLPASTQVFVVGSFDFSGTASAGLQARQLVAALKQTRPLEEIFEAPNVVVWEFS